MQTGINTYRVQPIIMKGMRVENIFDRIDAKLQSGISLTKEDLVPLTLCALMDGEMSQKERILKVFDITKQAKEHQGLNVEKIEAVVYAMAEKFLESDSIDEVKEVLGMTRLGQMLYNDGVESGIAQGMEQAKLDIAKNFLGALSDEEISEKTGVSLDIIKKMHTEI